MFLILNRSSKILKYSFSLSLFILMILFIPREIKAEKYCAEGIFADETNFIRIDKNIYLSTDGKLYQESDCKKFIAKNEFRELLFNYKDLRYTIKRRVIRLSEIPDFHKYETSYSPKEYFEHLEFRTREIEEYIPNILSVFNFETDLPEEQILRVLQDTEINDDKNSNIIPGKYQSNETIEISPTYYKKFIELERKPTLKEIIAIKRFILGEIDSKLRKKYQQKYIFIENNDNFLRSEIKLNKEITSNKWEILELTMTPVISNIKQIDIQVSAILKTQSGIGDKIPESKTFKISQEQESLEKYIIQLINFLKNKIPLSDFKLGKS